MNDELDNDLKRRISEVFDNFEDPTADEGWMLLREKFPPAAKHRGTAWLWWASAAAMFLLVLGIGIWINMDKPAGKPATFTKTTVKKQNRATNTPAETTAPQKEAATEPTNTNTTVASATDTYAATVKPPASISRSRGRANVTPSAVDVVNNAIAATRVAVLTGKKPKDSSASAQQAVNDGKYAATVPPVQTPAVTPDKPVVTADKTIIQAPVTNNVTQPVQASVMQKKPAAQPKTMLDILTQDDKMQAAARQQKAKTDNDKLVRFGVYAATYVNYAKGSDNNVNVGAGVSSDFRISKNVKLSTGVSIAQNSFNYTGTNELPRVATEASLVANAVKTMAAFGPDAAPPTIQKYNASLVGLDVPINIKYEFNPEKNDTYISAGLSSGTFINENYTYTYNYNAPFTESASQKINEKINEKFNEFYFAKTLNLAFGVGYPLGKSNRLVIEPFVKYPLAGLGVQQIKFGAGGINLKLNFQTRKK